MKLLASVTWLLALPCAAASISGTAAVSDGDTLRIGPVIVRIHGIDAPETDQPCQDAAGALWNCGAAAANLLADLADGRIVACAALEHDRYGRIVARCTVDEHDLGRELVASGMAWAYREYSLDYSSEEKAAQAEGKGVWAAQNVPPWEFRAGRWEREAANAPRSGCPIKGNISARGERIYHTPWSSSYTKTLIDEEKGERWFCDEAEAQAAGWRAPRGR
ncbi:thermonuclease family protein [Paracoccus sp. S-4012]|uniref:thermonuclease family protein n=1 Tax=Paracoccus sp. S-4012 TaxID=2665648 RepID=UPI0012B15AD8|nr:thermonuclease family protein [Paracoccus sp. S-4012]MRX52036.1 thermonuclease family protein [Paracoccus sp. S-4012]